MRQFESQKINLNVTAFHAQMTQPGGIARIVGFPLSALQFHAFSRLQTAEG